MSNEWWSKIRSILIGIHLLAITLKAIPAPEGGMNKVDWKNPTVQSELKTWTKTLNGIGLKLTTEQLEGQLWNLAREYMSIRRQILKPFNPYYRYIGSDQNWRLFVAPHMFPSKLHIELYIDQKWVPIYQQFSEYRWNIDLIETSRFRPAIFRYSWSRYKKHYRKMGQYFAKKAASDFPEATTMRTRWWQQKSPSPEQVMSNEKPKGKWRLIYHFDLEELR